MLLTVQQIAQKLIPIGEMLESTWEDGYLIVCPGHTGTTISGSIKPNPVDPIKGEPQLKCNHGCKRAKIVKALKELGLWQWGKQKVSETDLESHFYDRGAKYGDSAFLYYDIDRGGEPFVTGSVRRIDHFTADGVHVKTTRSLKRRTDDGRMIKATPAYNWPIYNKIAVLEKALQGRQIACVDTEEEVDILEECGLTAFTHQGGAEHIKNFVRAKPERDLAGVKCVMLLPHLDRASQANALIKARHLFEHGIPCKIVWLPGLLKSNQQLPAADGPGIIEWNKTTVHNANYQIEHDPEAARKIRVNELKELCDMTLLFEPEPGDELVIAELDDGSQIPVPSAPDKDGLDPNKHMMTETGNMEYFVIKYRGLVHWLEDIQAWALWDGKHHYIDRSEAVLDLVTAAIDEMVNDWLRFDRVDPKDAAKWRKQSLSAKGKANCVRLAKKYLKTQYKRFNRLKWHLNLKNGVLDLKRGILLDHKVHYFFSYVLDIEFPGKSLSDAVADCPRYYKFLEEIFAHDKTQIPAFLRLLALGLTGETHFRKWIMLYGKKGREGKSTVLKPLYWILESGDLAFYGKKSLFCRVRQENKLSDPGNLKGKLVGILEEVGKRDEFDNEKIKTLTGNEGIQGAKVFQDGETFMPSHTIYIFGNGRPKWDVGDDLASQERLIIVNFLRHFTEEEQDPNLDEDLRKELPGILVLLACHAYDIAHNGLQVHEAFIAAKEEYLKDQDIFGDFLDEVYTKYPGSSESSDDNYQAFCLWSKDEGHQRPWSRKKVGQEMRSRGYEGSNDGQGYVQFLGLQMKPEYRRRLKTTRQGEFTFN